MVQFVIKNPYFLKKIYQIPILKYFFVFHLNRLSYIEDEDVGDMIYRLIYVSDGTTKQTSHIRFKNLDNYTIQKYFNENKSVYYIHDVGVSSGVTSLALFNELVLKKIKTNFYISDKFSTIYYQKGYIDKFYDIEKNLMIGYIGPFVATDKIKPFYLSKILFKLIKKHDNIQPLEKMIKIRLFDRKVLNCIHNESIIDIDYDLFSSSLKDKFSFIRCMNLLNLGYFGREKIIQGLKNLRDSLKEGGVLLIGRTLQSGENHASFYKKSGGDIYLIEHFNKGSEVHHLIKNI